MITSILWLRSKSRSSMSILIETTNMILSSAAMKTNKSIDLSLSVQSKPKIDKELVALRNNVLSIVKQRAALNSSKIASDNTAQILSDQLCVARTCYKKKLREVLQAEDNFRDSQLSSFHSNPAAVYNNINPN